MIFLDSNIIITFFANSHEHHTRSHAFVIEESRKGTILLVCPQVMGEAFRGLTSKQAVEHPIRPEEFMRLSEIMCEAPNVRFVSPGMSAYTTAINAAVRLGVTSHRIYDLLLYGTMREHGITRLATFNVKHFSNLSDIELVQIP